jgi:excinuclease ABC subunit C
MDISDKLREKLKDLPDKPGCYMMRDRKGRIIYVGKAISLRKRVQSYFRKATLTNADPKLRGLIKSIGDLDYVVVRNDAEAVLTEGRLIKDYRPRYNVSFRDDKRFLLLCVDMTQSFPRFKLCRIKKADGSDYFGPYASSRAARAALDFIEKKFGLRKCTARLPSDEAYKHCINDIVRYCSAPCVEKINKDDYLAQVAEACAFLAGERPKYLKELRQEMEDASAKLDFERAAAIRDTLFRLHDAVKFKARVQKTPEMKRQDAKEGIQSLANILGLEKDPKIIEAYDISNISGEHAVASMVCAVNGMANRSRYRRFRIKQVQGIDDPLMMAEVIRRRFAHVADGDDKAPDLVLVDGGITQVRAARRELIKLGLRDVPVAGLAKKYEELVWRGGGSRIVLPKESNALQVLQRLRDEAHRFALTYHRTLRSRRIKESALDDIAGIGAERKELLLNHFGSVSRLKKATEQDIAAIKGIGPKMASMIAAALADKESRKN